MKAALILGCLVLLLCGGFFLLDRAPDTSDSGPAPFSVPEAPPPPPAGPQPDDPEPTPPATEEAEDEIAALIGLLASSRSSEREKAMIRLGELGSAARAALPRLEKIAGDPETRLRWAAMVAVMQIEGSRKYYAELAAAAAFPERRSSPAPRAFRRLDPVLAEAVVLAIRLSRGPRDNLTRPPGLERFLEQLYADEATGIEEMAEQMRSAKPRELLTWIVFLRRMKPVPTGVAPALRRTLEAGDDASRRHVLLLLGGTEGVGPGLRDAMTPFLRDLARNAEPSYRAALLPALGGLGATDPETMKMLRAGLGEGGTVTDGAAASLGRLGPGARPFLDDLLRAAESREPGNRYALLMAILATKDRRAIPFFRKALRPGHDRERRTILERVHEVEGAAGLAPDLLALVPKIGAVEVRRLLYCAVRCDPRLTRPESVRLVTQALGEVRPGSRRSALYLIRFLDHLPPDVATALAAALEHGRDDDLVNPAAHAIRGAAKFGETADAIVPVVLRLAEDRRFADAAVVALAAIRPEDPACVRFFRRMVLEGRSGGTQRGAIRALAARERPTKEDAKVLSEYLEDSGKLRWSSTRRAIREVLSRPEWKALLSE